MSEFKFDNTSIILPINQSFIGGLENRCNELEAENAHLRSALDVAREALQEMALPPHKDSNIASLYDWVNSRAHTVLSAIDAVLKGESK